MSTPENWIWADGSVGGGRAVIVDVDGVIADASHRQWYLDGARRDWRGFFEACVDDPPIDAVIRLVALFDPDVVVVLLTARPYYVTDQTETWLRANGVRWDLLVLRARADERTSSVPFKRRIVGELRQAGFDLELAIDDDINNVGMYHEEAVPAVYIHSGYYE